MNRHGGVTLSDSERAQLQRRIKFQRSELRRLNRDNRNLVKIQDRYREGHFNNDRATRANAYRHAAQLADKFWFGKRIADAIRKWCL